MPKITVVMNCLNGERFVRDAIESVYAQEYPDWEIVFWDNASTDLTAAIARSFDDRLRYFCSEQTVPLGQARALAFEQARGDWVALLDHDDTILPSRFRDQMAAIEIGDFVLSYGGYREIDERGKLLREVTPRHRSGAIVNALLMSFEVNIATVLMRRAELAEINPAKIADFVMADEYYFCLMLAARGDVCVVREILANYRHVSSSWSERTTAQHGAEFANTLAELRNAYPGIEQPCASGFALAGARAEYSDAKYFMQVGQPARARAILSRIGEVRRAYAVLYFVSFMPPLWRLLHRRDLKVRLTHWLPHFRWPVFR